MLLATFLFYLGVIALIAYRAWRQTHTVADYILGGRRISAPVAALSAGASDMSGWLLLGLPGLAVVTTPGKPDCTRIIARHLVQLALCRLSITGRQRRTRRVNFAGFFCPALSDTRLRVAHVVRN
jgi:Na+(H+)/acetate symporter ActP